MQFFSWFYKRSHTPLIPILISFTLGITVAYLLPGYYRQVRCMGVVILWAHLLACSLLTKVSHPYRVIVGQLFRLLALFLLGYYWLEAHNPLRNSSHFANILPKIEAYQGTLQEITHYHHYYTTLLNVTQVRVAGQWKKAQGKVKITGSKSAQDMEWGQLLEVQGSPTPIPPILNPHMTNWALFWRIKGVLHRHHLSHKSWRVLARASPYSLLYWLYQLRKKAVAKLSRSIEDPAIAGIVAAMLLGVRSQLEESVQSLYSDTGVMHILAVSGLHVGLLYYLLLLLLTWFSLLFPLLKRYQQRIALLILGLYAMLTGFAPPVLRAWSMLVVWQIGHWLQRDVVPANILACTAFILLIYNPYWLFSVSFQLSFAAIASIITLYNPLAKRYYFENDLLQKWWQITWLTVIIQIGTLPFTLYYFHSIALYGFLANWIMLPLASLLLLLGIVVVSMHHYLPLYKYSIHFLSWLFNLIHYCLASLRELPYATIHAIYWPLSTILLLYSGLVALLKSLTHPRKYYYYWMMLLSLLCFASKLGYDCYQRYHQPPKIIVYHVFPHIVIGFFTPPKAIFLIEGNLERHDSLFRQAIQPSLEAMKVRSIEWYRWNDCIRTHKLEAQEKNGCRQLFWKGISIVWVKQKSLFPKRNTLQKAAIVIVSPEQITWLLHHLSTHEINRIIVVGKPTQNNQDDLSKFYWLSKEGALIMPITAG